MPKSQGAVRSHEGHLPGSLSRTYGCERGDDTIMNLIIFLQSWQTQSILVVAIGIHTTCLQPHRRASKLGCSPVVLLPYENEVIKFITNDNMDNPLQKLLQDSL